MCNNRVWAASAVALSSVLFFVCLTTYILCQTQLRHKQAFRCVFERASPCLVSFPSPESNKGPSLRGQAAVSASLSSAGRCWCLGRQGAGYTYCSAGHKVPPPHRFHTSIAHPVWGTGHLVMCYACWGYILLAIARRRNSETMMGQDWTSLLS